MISKEIINDVISKINSKISQEILYEDDLSINIDEIDIDSIDNLSDLQESLETYVLTEPKYGIIYYNDANKYLSDNDPSFIEAMERYVYLCGNVDDSSVKSFNSSNLATVHLKGKILEIINEIIDEFSEDELELGDNYEEE